MNHCNFDLSLSSALQKKFFLTFLCLFPHHLLWKFYYIFFEFSEKDSMSLFLFPFISLSYLLFPLDFGSILPAHLLMHPSHSGQEQFYHFLSLLHFINSIDPRIPSYLIWLSFMAARPCHIKAISILTKHAN